MMETAKIRESIHARTIAEITSAYPVVPDFFANYNLQNLPQHLTVAAALAEIPAEQLQEFGLDVFSLTEELVRFIATLLHSPEEREQVRKLTIIGGRNKQGEAENEILTIRTMRIGYEAQKRLLGHGIPVVESCTSIEEGLQQAFHQLRHAERPEPECSGL